MPPKTTTWAIPPHTRAKHELLRRYLGAWFPVMASREKRLLFIDGFAGPGTYEDGSPGSPLVALDSLVSHSHFATFGDTMFTFLFVEGDRRRAASLRDAISKYFVARLGQPPNVGYKVIDGSFDGEANELVASITKGFVLIPTLAFIDPFGFKGTPMETICRLTASPKCEVLFSFMYDSLNRWITHPNEKIHVSLRDLFGCDDYDAASLMSGEQRRSFLHSLYRGELKKQGRFKYALDFSMIDDRGKNVISLIFATRHLTGLEKMKDAMWKLDPTGSYSFSDRYAGTTSLFDGEVDSGPLLKAILEHYRGEQITVEKLHEFVLEDTIFGANHYKRAVLSRLEKAGLMEVVSSSRKKANGYPPGTVLRF